MSTRIGSAVVIVSGKAKPKFGILRSVDKVRKLAEVRTAPERTVTVPLAHLQMPAKGGENA